MVVCKYFLQGTCKFGTYCHYDHEIPNNYTNPTSVLRQTNFGVQNRNTKLSGIAPASVDISTLVKSVINDMTSAEKGGQWLLSCYAPFKEKPAFPGFEDHSFEEIRLGFYEAQKNGAIDQYKQQLQALLQDSTMKIKALQNPSQEIISALQNIYNTSPPNCNGTFSQTLIPPNNSGLNQQSNNTFPNQNTPSFGPSENIFKINNISQNTTAPIVGGGSKSIFGENQQTQHQSILRNSAPNPNIFSNIVNQSVSQPSWSSAPGSNINPVNIFQSQTQPGLFQDNQNQPVQISHTGNLFTAQNPANSPPIYVRPQSHFGIQGQQTSAQAPHLVTSNQPLNIFDTNKVTSTIFSNDQTSIKSNSLAQQYSESIFGVPATSAPPVVFGSVTQQIVHESLYSKLEELSDNEKNWFQSDSLDIMNIPDKPPTYDMCFKI